MIFSKRSKIQLDYGAFPFVFDVGRGCALLIPKTSPLLADATLTFPVVTLAATLLLVLAALLAVLKEPLCLLWLSFRFTKGVRSCILAYEHKQDYLVGETPCLIDVETILRG